MNIVYFAVAQPALIQDWNIIGNMKLFLLQILQF